MDKKYQVFISSTYADMLEERQAAVTAILEAGHIPAGMELFAASDKKQMEVIERWIDGCDIFMLILGGRYGSIDPDSGKSYIQLEYEYAVKTGKPFFALYLTENAIREKANGTLGLDAIERNDSRKLSEFRITVLGKMCSPIEDVKDIRIQAGNSIRHLSTTNTLDGWVRASTVNAAMNRQAALPPKIEIITGQTAPYRVDEVISDHVQSTVRIGVRNAGGQTLSNCKVFVENISPPLKSPGGPTLLLQDSGFQLRHDDPPKQIDIAAHWDNWDKFKFSTPSQSGFFDGSQYMEDGLKRTFTVRVTATECKCSAMFEIWVDDSKKLHLTFLHYID